MGPPCALGAEVATALGAALGTGVVAGPPHAATSAPARSVNVVTKRRMVPLISSAETRSADRSARCVEGMPPASRE
jgi:hypothetical protein